MDEKVGWQVRTLQHRMVTILTRRQTWLTLGILALLIALLLVRGPILALIDRAEAVRAWVQSFGPLAPLAYIALFVAQILLAPVPGHFMGLMGGYLFGAVWGSLYSLIGLGLGAGLAATVARRLGRPLIQRLMEEEQLRYWERRLRVRSAFTWWLIFLFPVPDVIYYVAGLSGVPLRWLLVAVLAGRGPGLVMGNWVGDLAVALPPELVAVMLVFLAAVVFTAYRHQRRLRLLMLLTLRRVRRLRRRFW
jgi:uncharacterized membrane protein YdjX (TVP38/TMEM64 family)